MKIFICVLTCIFVFAVRCFGMDTMQEIKKLYRDMYLAMINKDSTKLSEILADSFVLVHMTGMKQGKHEYINAITSGVLNYYSEQTENISITIHGNKAEITGQSRVEAKVFGGGRHTWRLQLDIVLVNDGSRWLMTRAEASTY